MLYGTGGRVFSIDHSYYTLDGFTIDGQEDINPSAYQDVTSVSQVRGKKDGWQGSADNSKLVYVGAGTKAGIAGTTISNMFLTGSAVSVRFRNQTANGLVVNSVIQWCGMLGLGVEPDQYKYHNAEGVYIGTSPKSTTQPFYHERHQQQHRGEGLHDQHLRLGVLRGEGERAPQPYGERRLRLQRRASGEPGQQRRAPGRPQHRGGQRLSKAAAGT